MTIQLKELKAKKDPFDINQITAKDLSNEMNESIQKMTNMKNHKKISISSTHGVGKTTLINLIKKIYKTEKTIFYPESAIIVNEMNKKRYRLNQESNIDTQRLIMKMEVITLTIRIYIKTSYVFSTDVF